MLFDNGVVTFTRFGHQKKILQTTTEKINIKKQEHRSISELKYLK